MKVTPKLIFMVVFGLGLIPGVAFSQLQFNGELLEEHRIIGYKSEGTVKQVTGQLTIIKEKDGKYIYLTTSQPEPTKIFIKSEFVYDRGVMYSVAPAFCGNNYDGIPEPSHADFDLSPKISIEKEEIVIQACKETITFIKYVPDDN